MSLLGLSFFFTHKKTVSTPGQDPEHTATGPSQWRRQNCWYQANLLFSQYMLYFFLFLFFLILKSLILTCVSKHEPPSHLPTHNISLGHPHVPAPSMLHPTSDMDWRFNSYMTVYMLEFPFSQIIPPFRMDWLGLLEVQGILKSLLQHHSSKASILQCSAFFTIQLSHPYMTTGKTIALTRWTLVVVYHFYH